jgi:hypothetical protein
MFRLLGRILGWAIIIVFGGAAIAAAIIFFGYIILWVLAILIGVGLLFGLLWLLSKLL